MFKRFKGSARNLAYVAGLIMMIIILLLVQLMMELSVIERMANLFVVFALLYCTVRFFHCYTHGIRISYSELCVARFTKNLTIPIKLIKQVQMQGENLHITLLDRSEFQISLKSMNEIDRKVITSLIKYYAPNLRD